ncbi:hypothetical protein K0U73_12385 [bacterium]|nr:hypothetical protein [bacterium]
MVKFIVQFVIFFVIFVLSLLPLKRVSTIISRRFNQKKWLRGAAITAFIVAGLGWSSRNLQQACRSERNDGCVDIGGVGSQVVVAGLFIIFALASAYMAYND